MINQTTNVKNNPIHIAGFWRRSFAFLIDICLLTIFGLIVGAIFFHFLAKMGPFWGRAIGFVITLLYFVILDSKIGSGQTLGKKILRIMVVQKDTGFVSIPKSFARSFLFFLPSFLNGLYLPFDISPLVSIVYLITVFIAVFGLATIITYFYLFNVRTRQSVHDLMVQSYVVKKAQIKEKTFPIIWRGHFIVCAALLFFMIITIITGGIYGWYEVGAQTLWREAQQDKSLQVVYNKVRRQDNVMGANVLKGFYYDYGAKTKYKTFTINIIKSSTPNRQKDIPKIIKIVLNNYKNIDQYDYLVINESYGFNLFLARFYSFLKFAQTPEQCREIILKLDEVDAMKKNAASGDSKAQYILGNYYLNEGKTEKEKAKAFVLLKKAADENVDGAANDLALAYSQGIGTDKDNKKAVEYYKKGARLGDQVAMFNLGLHYFYGAGIDKNYKQAKYWFEQAAISNEPNSQYMLALIYANGFGVKKNLEKAKIYLTRIGYYYYDQNFYATEIQRRNQYINIFVDYSLSNFLNNPGLISENVDKAMLDKAKEISKVLKQACSVNSFNAAPY